MLRRFLWLRSTKYQQARIQLAGQADEPLAGALLTSLEALAPTPFDLVSKLAHLLLRNSAALISREGSFCGVDCR